MYILLNKIFFKNELKIILIFIFGIIKIYFHLYALYFGCAEISKIENVLSISFSCLIFSFKK